jgi:cardiolipin synthase A/B
MFGLTEPSMVQMLQKKARSLPVKVFYDPNASRPIVKTAKNLFPSPVASKGLMHQKILVIDDAITFLGSANMTRSSLQMHDNLMIGFHSRAIAKFLQEKTPHTSGHMKTLVADQPVDIWLLPDPRGHALHAIKKLIRRSRKKIQLAMFTLSHPVLIDEMIEALRRGVSLEVAIDFQSSFGASKKAITKLKKEGATIYLSQASKLLHHKFLTIDDQTLVVGSANWTKAAFYKNHDCFAILYRLSDKQKSFIHTVWRKIKQEAKTR